MGEEYAVEMRDVVKRFGNITAVNHVSIKIRDGEFFSLLGPSGCGKTTSLRLIAGFDMPTAGQIYIGGEPQGYLPAYQRPVNTVFQHYALFPHMTVARNVAFGLEMTKVSKDEIKHRVNEMLELVQLRGMGDRKPRQLSGGQQQRVALARALVNHPKVLLLDEPLGALDLKLRKAMQIELKAIQLRVGITFVYVTHDQEEALTMSNRIAVMDRGKLLQVGTPEEVYEKPSTRFVSDFIGETNYLEGRVASIINDVAEINVEPGMRIVVQPTPELKTNQQVTVAFRPEKVAIREDIPGDANALNGVIREVVYIGSITTFLVELPGNSIVVCRQQNISGSAIGGSRVGDKVTLVWPVEATKLFIA